MSPSQCLNTLARQLVSGRYDLLAAHYVFPLPVYIDTECRVVGQAAQIWPFFQTLHAQLRADGYGDLEPRLMSIELAQKARFRMWVDWKGLRTGAEPALLFRTLCYNEGTHADFRSVMVRFDTQPWPQLSQALAA